MCNSSSLTRLAMEAGHVGTYTYSVQPTQLHLSELCSDLLGHCGMQGKVQTVKDP